jgi:hypothetical protein
MIEVDFDGDQWRASAAHSEETGWQSVIRFLRGESGNSSDPLALLSQLTRKPMNAG